MELNVTPEILQVMVDAAYQEFVSLGRIHPQETCDIEAVVDAAAQQIIITFSMKKSRFRKKPTRCSAVINFDPEGGGPVAAA